MKRGTVWLLCGVGGYFAFQALVLRDWLAGAIGAVGIFAAVSLYQSRRGRHRHTSIR